MQSVNLEKMLTSLRNKELPDDIDYLETRETILAGIANPDYNIAEQYLISLYYFSFITEPQDLDLESINEIIGRLYKNALTEENEKIRGRLIWMMLHDLIEENEFNEIKTILYKLDKSEESVFVWERVLAAFSTKHDSYKFYPEILMKISAFEKIVPEKWKEFIKSEEEYIRSCLNVTNNINLKMETWLNSMISEEIDLSPLSSIVYLLANTGTPLPFSEEQLFSYFSKTDAQSRRRLLSFFEVYLSNLDNRERDDLFGNLEVEGEAICDQNQQLAQQLSSRLLKLTNIVPGFDKPSDYEQSYMIMLSLLSKDEHVLRKIIDFLNKTEWSKHQSGLVHDICKKYSPHLLQLISDSAVPQSEILKTVELLSQSNPFFKKLGATILLNAHRSGYDVKSILELIKDEYEKAPDIKNAFAKGSDINEEEFEYGFKFPSKDLFGQKNNDSEEEGFMKLGNLTGMLESCQPPDTAYRLKLILQSFKQETRINLSENDIFQKKQSVIGPMSIDEVIDIFLRLANDNTDAAAIIKDKDDEIAKVRFEKLEIDRRNQTKAVFEGNEVDAITNYTLMRELIRKDGFNWPKFTGPGPENTPDYLALYLKRNGLDDKHFYSGVYFNAANMLAFINYIDLPAADLTNAVAVHELYHAFCEDMTKNAHSHSGENPDYCKLEEAAANRVAFNWARENLLQESNETLRTSLFATLDISPTALPGYADYPLLDNEASGWVPVMLEEENHAQPPEYRNRKLILNAEHQRTFETNSLIWRGMLGELKTNESVCWFIDFR